MIPTNLNELRIGDLWLGFRMSNYLIAGSDPSRADESAHLWQPRDLSGDSVTQFSNAVTGTVVNRVLSDQQLRKYAFQVREIQLGATFVTMSGYKQCAGVAPHS